MSAHADRAKANGCEPASAYINIEDGVDFLGLTKRESFAQAAMAGLLADPDCMASDDTAILAVEMADALLLALEGDVLAGPDAVVREGAK